MNDTTKVNAKELVVGLIDEMKVSPLIGDSISNNSELSGELNIDSLNKLILLTRLTEHLGIEFSKSKKTITEFKTVGDLVAFAEESSS